MELVDEIYSSTTEEEEEENSADEDIFVCTSIASASTDELEEIRPQQQKRQTMELIDEIHSSEDEEIIFVSSKSSSAEGTDKKEQPKQMTSAVERIPLKCDETAEEDGTDHRHARKGHTERQIFLPLTQKFLPAFPKLDSDLYDDSDSDDFDEPIETQQQLTIELANQTLSFSDRAKKILRLLSDVNSEFSSSLSEEDDQPEEKPEPFATICTPRSSVCPTPSQPSGGDDDEIEYIGTTIKER